MSEGKSSGGSRFFSLVLIALLLLYAVKVYLRDPDYRHVEVCYLPYKIGHLVWVDLWGFVVTDDTATHLKHSRDVTSFFRGCVDTVGQQTWLRKIGTDQQ